MNRQITIAFQFVFYVLLQGLVLSNVDLFGFITPYLYIIVLLLLPVEISPSLGLGIAFLLGAGVDLFTSTWGMHISACVFTAFIRPFALRFLAPRDGYPVGAVPNLSQMGLSWFLTYTVLIVFFHHTFLFFVEVFRFEEFFRTLGRAISSVLFTLLLILLVQFVTYRPSRSL